MADTRCPVCVSEQRVLSSKFESDVGSTDVYSVIELGCLNDSLPTNGGKPCPRYAGGANPDPSLITTVRNKVN